MLFIQPEEFKAGWMSRMTETLLPKSSGGKAFWGFILSHRFNLLKQVCVRPELIYVFFKIKCIKSSINILHLRPLLQQPNSLEIYWE